MVVGLMMSGLVTAIAVAAGTVAFGHPPFAVALAYVVSGIMGSTFFVASALLRGHVGPMVQDQQH